MGYRRGFPSPTHHSLNFEASAPKRRAKAERAKTSWQGGHSPVGDALQQTPEDWLGKRSPTSRFPPFPPTLCLDVLCLQPVHEDSFQGTAERVRVPIVAGYDGV